MVIQIKLFFRDSKFVKDYKRDARQYVVYESEIRKYYEIYVYKKHESDPDRYDILIDHYTVPKQLFMLQM